MSPPATASVPSLGLLAADNGVRLVHDARGLVLALLDAERLAALEGQELLGFNARTAPIEVNFERSPDGRLILAIRGLG